MINVDELRRDHRKIDPWEKIAMPLIPKNPRPPILSHQKIGVAVPVKISRHHRTGILPPSFYGGEAKPSRAIVQPEEGRKTVLANDQVMISFPERGREEWSPVFTPN